ncbi:MAG: polyphosphate kinase [Lewinellaceae bacterium]|nr:polyphosphate kinase [Lewinellaceae bacterium]
MIKLSEIPTTPPPDVDEDKLKDKTDKLVERLGELQKVMFAEQKHSALVIFQGMDASGKDGAVKHVFKECHAQGIQVHSFKKPTDEEFAHDFLWRVHKQVPRRGMIQIFNRSHYEDILIQRVHSWINDEKAEKRMNAINAFEELLAFDNHTVIFKFYLHISYSQQEKELKERIRERDKNWKHNPNDWKEREHWDDYMRYYEYAINKSSIPWTIVPVDERWYRNYIVAKTIVDQLEKLNMEYPPLPEG